MEVEAPSMSPAAMSNPHQLARWLGRVYIAGGAVAVAWTLVPHRPGTGDSTVMLMAVLAILGGVAMLAGLTDSLRMGMFHFIIAAVQMAITVGYVAVPDPSNDARLFYIWATPIAAFFFRASVAAAHAALVGVALAIALVVHHASWPQAARLWLMTMGALATVTALVAWAAVGVRRRDAAMSFAALHDPLTGLPNRALLTARAEAALTRRQHDGGNVFMLLADLDRFKLLNDTHGHHAGDELLVLLAPRLVANAPSGATVSRLGGDEFAVLVDDPSGQLAPKEVAQRLALAWAEPLHLRRGLIHTSACLGITVASDGDHPQSLLRHADAAMYRVKRRGHGGIGVYDEHDRALVGRRLRVEQALHDALAEEQFSIVYQPVVDLAEGRVRSAEALLRWTHPELGTVHPGEFVPVAEEAGLIDRIGLWVVERALGDLDGWRRAGVTGDSFSVAVNVSKAQLHGEFACDLRDLLDRRSMTSSSLTLDLTEAVLMVADAEAPHVLDELQRLGFSLALDDFGIGYSALSCLHHGAVDMVKIDQSFVGGITSDPTRLAIVRAVVGLASELNLSVVAKGVETAEQAELLLALGCTRAQGFLLGRPMSAELLGADLVSRLARR